MTTPRVEQFLYEIRCSCCWRLLGVSAAKKWGVYCDLFCASDIPAVAEEQRDSVLEAIHRDSDVPVAQLAKQLGFSRQRLYQLFAGRDLRKQAAKA